MGLKQFLTNNWRFVNSNNLLMNRCANSVLESQNTGYAQKAVEIKLPERPKKPIPPFFQFLRLRRLEVTENQNLSYKDSVRVVSEMWKDYDQDLKQNLIDMYVKELEEYKNNILAYKENLTEEQKNELFRVKHELAEQKSKRKHRKELKELGKPRKPASAYILFVTEEIKNRGNLPVQKYMEVIARKWSTIDAGTKTKYFDAASEEYNKYIQALQNWEDKMIKAGRVDLIRNRPISDDITDDK